MIMTKEEIEIKFKNNIKNNIILFELKTLLNSSTENESNIIFHTLSICEFNELACNTIISLSNNKYEEFLDRINLIYVLKECDFDSYSYKVCNNPNLISKFNRKELSKIMFAIHDCSSMYSYQIVMEAGVLSYRTADEIVKLMYALKNFEYNQKSVRVIFDFDLLTKTVDEQIDVMSQEYNKYLKELEESKNKSIKLENKKTS